MRPQREVLGQEPPRLPIPVHAGAARARGNERNDPELAHRQRRLVDAVAKRQRLAHGLLEKTIAHRVAELVLDRRWRKVRYGVAKAAALQCEDVQTLSDGRAAGS